MAATFDFKNRLGSGYFGDVWHAIDNGLGCDVALKCIPSDKIINQKNFFQEAQVLKKSEHPNVVRVNDTGTLDDGRIYVSMEYLPRGSIEDEAKGAPLPLTRVKKLMVDTLRGLGHAHQKGVVHRDVKPANILVGNAGEGKLSDFGLAVPDIQSMDIAGLKQYQYVLHLAPEVKKVQDYTPVSDIYAAGATLYRLVNGDTYLPSISPAKARALARKGKFPPRDKYRAYVPQSLKRLVNKALNVDPKLRFQSADEMRRAIEAQDIRVDWIESASPIKSVWKGFGTNGQHYRVSKTRQSNMKWMIEVKKGGSPATLRRIGSLCVVNKSKQDADKFVRHVLQDFVTGKA